MNEKENNAWARKHNTQSHTSNIVCSFRSPKRRYVMLLVYGTFKCRSTMGWKAAMGMLSSANPALKMDEPLSIIIALFCMSTTLFVLDR